MHRAVRIPTVVLAFTALGAACADRAPRRADPVAEAPAVELRGTILEPPWEKPDVTLTDTDGRAFEFRVETEGRVTLLFFGYTHCPDVCPIHMGNLAAVLASMGKEILVADNDSQGNATNLLGVERSELGLKTLGQAMLDKAPCDEYIVATNIERVSLLAGTPILRRVISEMGSGHWQDKLLRKPFETKKLDEYDFVLIDTHGSVDCLLKSSLTVSDD